jgi:hypothetical protein
MPQPIPFRQGAAGIVSTPQCILQRLKLAALIGALGAEWGEVDQMLVWTYDALISHDGGVVRAANPVNIAVFETLGALNSRLDIIQSVIKIRTPSLFEEFIPLRKFIRDRAGERGKYVHGHWAISDDFPDDLIVTSGAGNVRYQEHDFKQALDRATEVRVKVLDFHIRACYAPRSGT